MTLQQTIPFEPPTRDPDIEWRDLAACQDTEVEMVAERMSPEHEAAAKAVCAGCVVVEDCLAYSIATSSMQGVYGGMTGEERMRWRRRPQSRRMVADWVDRQHVDVMAARLMGRLR